MNCGNFDSVQKARFRQASCAFLVWMTFNISLSFTNKYLFAHKNFRFPILIVMLGTFSTFLGTAIVLLLKFEKPQIQECKNQWKTLLAFAIIHGIDIGLENFSIVYISISLNQIIKATVPAMTLVLSWLLEGKTYDLKLIITTAMTVAGAVMAVYKNPQIIDDGWYGAIAAGLSACAAAVSTVLLGVLLQREHINAVAIACYTSLPGAILLFPPFLLFEYQQLVTPPTKAADLLKRQHVTYILLALCFLALLYNLSRLWLINSTEAHHSAVAGNIKNIVLVGGSMVVFGDHRLFSARTWAGMLLTFIGFSLYSYFKLKNIAHNNAVADGTQSDDGSEFDDDVNLIGLSQLQ